MSQSQGTVVKIYKSVIEDVISGVRDAFLDEGVDEQVLLELKQIWEQKLVSSKAVETNPDPPEPQYPQKDIGRNNLPSKTGNVYSYQSSQNAMQNANQQGNMHTQHTNQLQSHSNQTHSVQSHHQQHQSQIQQQTQQQHPSHQQTSQLSQQNIHHHHHHSVHHHHQQQQQQQHHHHQPPQHHQQASQQQQQPPQQHHQQQTQQQQQQHQPTNSQQTPAQTVLVTDPSKQVPIQITLPAQAGGEPRVLTIQVPASALQGNQLQQVLTGPVITATMALPVHLASSLLQQHVNAALQGQVTASAVQLQPSAIQQNNSGQHLQNQSNSIRQLDGTCDSSEEEEEEDEDDDVDDEEENEEREEDENEEENADGQEEEPLNSEDDVSEEDPTDLFDTDNVVVCQYDKITRSRNKWKFYLKDGIMNLNGKDFVFQKAGGDAEW